MSNLSFIIKCFFFLNYINYCIASCPIELPFLKNKICIASCLQEDSECILDNEIIKTQYLNNIISIGPPDFHYINVVTSENSGLIFLTSCYPSNIMDITKYNTRIFFGLTKEGKGYFIQNNKRTTINEIIIQSVSRFSCNVNHSKSAAALFRECLVVENLFVHFLLTFLVERVYLVEMAFQKGLLFWNDKVSCNNVIVLGAFREQADPDSSAEVVALFARHG